MEIHLRKTGFVDYFGEMRLLILLAFPLWEERTQKEFLIIFLTDAMIGQKKFDKGKEMIQKLNHSLFVLMNCLIKNDCMISVCAKVPLQQYERVQQSSQRNNVLVFNFLHMEEV